MSDLRVLSNLSVEKVKVFRVRRVSDGLFYKGPMYKNVFTVKGKVYKTRREAQRLVDDFGEYSRFSNGVLEVVES